MPRSEQSRHLTEQLQRPDLDFSGHFMAISAVRELAQKAPRSIGPPAVDALRRLFQDRRFDAERQVFFLYQAAAEALAAVYVRGESPAAVRAAEATLKTVVTTEAGAARRAAAEALGGLPIAVSGPADPASIRKGEIPAIPLAQLLASVGVHGHRHLRREGRSLVVPLDENGCFVVKLGFSKRAVEGLMREVDWMAFFGPLAETLPDRWHIPRPAAIGGKRVFRPVDLPAPFGSHFDRPPQGAVAFFADRDYFVYPNDTRPDRRPSPAGFAEMIYRSARLLGTLAGRGMVHTAPIPLFHNRTQQHRRDDGGIYQWPRGGRLDRWLDSCRYPNFGRSGVRDFEHFESIRSGGRSLYRRIGAHLLSLILVSGSYFRGRAPLIRGMIDGGRQPVDVRRLFEPDLFAEWIDGIVRHYLQGFSGNGVPQMTPLDCRSLVAGLIDRMGVDRDMEEILRTTDQEAMSDAQFLLALIDGGYLPETAARVEKGAGDITLLTGPHLGGFNDRISVPELIDFVSTASALCVAGRFGRQNNQCCVPEL